jgi:ParB-like chromosome segregation protein Spo0J
MKTQKVKIETIKLDPSNPRSITKEAFDKIETIKLDPSNPRSITKEAFESLKQSITDFPEMQSVKPLVVADGYALAGNMRLMAYKDLGYRELHVLDVSEWSQAKRELRNLGL